MIGRILFRVAKGRFIGNTVGIAFQYLSFMIPVRKVFNSKKVIGFFHPKPSYKEHMVFVPKKPISNLIELSKDNNNSYFIDIWNSAQKVAKQSWDEKCVFVICANSGKRQEVQQVHFHLFKEHRIVNSEINEQVNIIYSDKYVDIIKHSNSNWELHFIIRSLISGNDKQFEINTFLIKAISCIEVVDSEYNIIRKGYTFVYQNDSIEKYTETPTLHIVSGKRAI